MIILELTTEQLEIIARTNAATGGMKIIFDRTAPTRLKVSFVEADGGTSRLGLEADIPRQEA